MDGGRSLKSRGIHWGILIIVLAAATSAGVFWWGRQTIAVPACEALARAEGMRFDGYIPIDVGQTNRSTPDGECRLARPNGTTFNRSLSRQLRGWQQITSVTLRYDLVFLAAFVLWGLIVAAVAGGTRRSG